jgi:hypothetical protein
MDHHTLSFPAPHLDRTKVSLIKKVPSIFHNAFSLIMKGVVLVHEPDYWSLVTGSGVRLFLHAERPMA